MTQGPSKPARAPAPRGTRSAQIRRGALRLALGALLLAALAGCAGAPLRTRASAPPPPPPLADAEVQQALEACMPSDPVPTEGAMRACEQVLEEFGSPDGWLETLVLTNLSLMALEAGDRSRFLRYADRLHRESQGFEALPVNTQFVLALLQCMPGPCGHNKDPRIAPDMFESLKSALEGRKP